MEMITPNGHEMRILGDPTMSEKTREALGIMADLVYQMALKGQI